MPTLRRDAVENRAALLDAARVCLNQDPEASLEVIAAEAGLSRRAVYGHFPTRDDLMREVTAHGAARIASAVAGTAHPVALIELALIAGRLWSEVDSIQVMAVFAVRGSLKSSIADGLAPLRAMVRVSVERGQADGTIRTDIAADRLARLVEDSLLSVFDESTRSDLPHADGHRLTMLSVLGTLGLSWREASALIDSTKELL